MKSKIFTLLGLAALAVPVLASCGGDNGKQVKPGVYFFAEASSIEYDQQSKKVSYKKERYRDTECAIVEVENGDNLKYGEQDVVVTIKPQTLFTFKEWDYDNKAAEQTWKQRGRASRPYVGLGSPTNLYSYELAENVAWTFEDLSEESTTSPGYQVEKYKITVKKEFFKRNIVIAYGVTDGHPVFVHTSEHYKTNIKVKDANGADLTDPMWKQFFSKPSSKNSAFGPGDGMMFTFNANDSEANLEDNALIGFDSSWETIVLDADNPDPDNPTKYTYDNFDVYGLKHDEKDLPIENSKVLLSQVDKDEKKYNFNFTRTGGPDYDDSGESSSATFYVPWGDIITNEGYEVKYDEIQLRLNKMPVLTDVSANSNSAETAIVEGGYFNATKADDKISYSDNYRSDKFHFVDSNGTFYNMYGWGAGNKPSDGADFVLGPKESKSGHNLAYGVSIIAAKDNVKVSLDFTVEDEKGSEEYSASIDTTKNSKTTDWRSKQFAGGGEQKNYELNYWFVNDWYLVKLTTSQITREFFGLAGDAMKDKDVYYLHPNPSPKYGSDPFAFTNEADKKTEPASKLKITVSSN